MVLGWGRLLERSDVPYETLMTRRTDRRGNSKCKKARSRKELSAFLRLRKAGWL